MAIFLPENQALGNNSYELPDELKKHLTATFAANAQYTQSPGFKKVTHMVNPEYNDRSKGKKTQGKKGIPYSNLKKLKMTFDYADPKSLEYTLLGGEEMKHWVNDTLNRERTKVAPELKRKKNEKLKNNTKPATPKDKSLKSGNIKLNIRESLNENPYISYLEDYRVSEIFNMFECKKRPWTNLINPEMYHKALMEFMKFGKLVHFPTNKIYQWFGIIMRNTAILRAVTEIAGHDVYSAIDEFLLYFFYDYDTGDVDYDAWNKYKDSIGFSDDYGAMTEFLEEKEFFEWFQLPDGSDPWSDFDIEPLEKIISEYNNSMPPEKVLVLINKALDVVHCREDLSSIFITGGTNALTRISESINRKTIHLTENQLQKLSKNLIKESYNSNLYHITTIPHLYSILQTDTIYSYYDCDDYEEKKGSFVSLSRTKNTSIGYKKSDNPVVIEIDTNKLMSSCRNAKLKPYNWGDNTSKGKGQFEFEERFYNNITPLSEYVVSINVYIDDINDISTYEYCDEVDEVIGYLEEKGVNPTPTEINMWFLKRIMNDFPKFKNIIKIHNK